MSIRCHKCGGRVIEQQDYDSVSTSLVRICQICGQRDYLADKPRKIEKWSPGETKEAPRRSVAQARAERDAMATSKQRYTYKDCLECGQNKRIIARGLCGACYPRLKKSGELDSKYPAKVNPSQKVAKIVQAPDKKCQPLVVQDVEHKSSHIDQKYLKGLVGNPDSDRRIFAIKAADISDKVQLLNVKHPNFEVEICVNFLNRDKDLYMQIAESADKNRRSLDQEILFRLEQGMVS